MASSRPIVMPLDLTIRDLIAADLPGLGWSGSPGHVDHVAQELERVPTDAFEHLVACLPSGRSVGKIKIDYEQHPGVGTLTQLAVHETLQSCGIGTALIRTAEARIRVRHVHQAEIAVEENNPRALSLYERLGYVPYDRRPESWMQDKPDGTRFRYETTCVWLRKSLS